MLFFEPMADDACGGGRILADHLPYLGDDLLCAHGTLVHFVPDENAFHFLDLSDWRDAGAERIQFGLFESGGLGGGPGGGALLNDGALCLHGNPEDHEKAENGEQTEAGLGSVLLEERDHHERRGRGDGCNLGGGGGGGSPRLACVVPIDDDAPVDRVLGGNDEGLDLGLDLGKFGVGDSLNADA